MRRKRILFVLAVLLGGALITGCMPEKAEESQEASDQQQPQVFQQSEGEPALSEKAARSQRHNKKKPRRLPDKLALRNKIGKKIAPPAGAKVKGDPTKAAVKTAYKPGEAPRIGANEPVFDYGTVAQGASVKHTFTIKNLGKNPLVIERAEGG